MSSLLDRCVSDQRISELKNSFDGIVRLHQEIPSRTHPEVAKTKRAFRDIVRTCVATEVYGNLLFNHRIVHCSDDGIIPDVDVHPDFFGKILMTIGSENRSLATMHFPNWGDFNTQNENPMTTDIFRIHDTSYAKQSDLSDTIPHKIAGWFMAADGQVSVLNAGDAHAAAPMLVGESKLLLWAYSNLYQSVPLL